MFKIKCLFLALMLVLVSPVLAQDAPPAEPDIDQLIAEIEDPAKREELIGKLKLLQEAKSGEQAEDPTEANVMPIINQQIEYLATITVRLGDWITRLPNLVNWAKQQYESPNRRAFWQTLAVELAVTLGVGLLFGWLARAIWAARKPAVDATAGPVAFYLITREVLSIAALAIAIALATLWFGGNEDLVNLVVRISLAIMAYRLSAMLIGLAFNPQYTNARWVPVSGELAALSAWWLKLFLMFVVLAMALPILAGTQAVPPMVSGIIRQIIYFALLIVFSIMLFRLVPPLASELMARDPTISRHFLIDRLPLLGTLGAVAAYIFWSLGLPGGASFLVQAVGGTIITLFVTAAGLKLIDKQRGQSEVETETVSEEEGSEDQEDQEPEIRQDFKGRYGDLIQRILQILLILVAALSVFEFWGIGILSWLWSNEGRAAGMIFLRALIVGAIVLSAWWLVSYFVGRYVQAVDALGRPIHSSRNRTLATFFRNLVLFILAVFSIIFLLGQVGVDATALLAGAGVIGLAIGFGSQKLVQDLINGLFILLGNTIRVGDVVDIGGRSGVVEAMSMRTVTLRSYNGDVHTIPYNSIDSTTNMTKDFSQADFNIGFGYGENVDRVRDVLREIYRDMRRVRDLRREMTGEIDIAGVDQLGDSAVVIKGRIRTRPGSQWMIRREFTRRVKLRFDELGIQIPFPQRTVHVVGSSKDPDKKPDKDAGLAQA